MCTLRIAPVDNFAIKVPRLEIRCNAKGQKLGSSVAGLHSHKAITQMIQETNCNTGLRTPLPLLGQGSQMCSSHWPSAGT